MRKIGFGLVWTLFLVGLLTLSSNLQPVKADGTVNSEDDVGLLQLGVHNLNTSLNYAKIQEAIDAPETLDGHVILVDAGTYDEHVYIYKSLTLMGENRGTTIITDTVDVAEHTDHVKITGFTIKGGGFLGANIGFNGPNDYCTVENNIITGSYWDGIFADTDALTTRGSSHLRIFANIISYCGNAGIEMYDEDNSTVQGNTIENNLYGFLMIEWNRWNYNHNSYIFHNNFINSGVRHAVEAGVGPFGNVSWDSGYPSGGNYWDDYTGTDANGDGIGDTPYYLDYNRDNYPFMKPCASIIYPAFQKGGKTYSVLVVSNSTIIDSEAKHGDLRLTVSGTLGTSGYVRVIQPVGMNSSKIKVFVNNTRLVPPPYPEITTNGTHYFIYFVVTFQSIFEIDITFGILGDANYDGTVNILDCIRISNSWGTHPGDPKWNPHTDFNEDETINILDCIIISNNWGNKWL